MTNLLRPIVIGLVAGFLGGMFGVGGGLIIVPGLVLWMRLQQHRAHATSVAAIVAAAAAALTPLAASDEVDWGAAAVLFVGSGAGAVLGAHFIGKIPPVWLARGFVALALISAARLGFGS